MKRINFCRDPNKKLASAFAHNTLAAPDFGGLVRFKEIERAAKFLIRHERSGAACGMEIMIGAREGANGVVGFNSLLWDWDNDLEGPDELKNVKRIIVAEPCPKDGAIIEFDLYCYWYNNRRDKEDGIGQMENIEVRIYPCGGWKVSFDNTPFEHKPEVSAAMRNQL